MSLSFIPQIQKGNRTGTGLIYIPKKKSIFFNLGQRIEVQLIPLNIRFFAKIIKYPPGSGIYVPKKIIKIYRLLSKKVKIQIKKIEGFYSKIFSDGRIHIPKDIVENQKLKHNNIVLIKGIENGEVVREKYSKIYCTKRKNRKSEYLCVFDKNFYGKQILFKVKKLSKETYKRKLNPLLNQALKDFQWAFIGKDRVIIFKGNKVSTIVNTNLKLSDFIFYLGAYFADGTKKGNSWAICASTFEQAKYYLKMHNLLIKDSKLEFTISYTNIYNFDDSYLKRKLAKIWETEVGIKVDKFRIRKPTGKLISKWNKYGTLVIREHRQILLDFYNALLNSLIKEILSKNNKRLAIDFLCGVMEGDGSASASERGHILFFSNKTDKSILKKVLKVTGMNFTITKEGENKYTFRIGVLEILRNLFPLKSKIFILYPKRRKIFFERLKTVGAVKFLIENHKPTNWVKAWLKNNGFCNENYQLTKKGLKLKDELIANINKDLAKNLTKE